MKHCFTVFVLALSSVLACADTLTFTSTGSNVAGSVYAYPYYLSLDGAASVPMMCLSYNNEIVLGESWIVNVLPLTTVPELEAAWLLRDAQAHPADDVADNLAAWSLFAANVPASPEASAQLALAVAGYRSVRASDFVLGITYLTPQ
jgi:hypothetical protein